MPKIIISDTSCLIILSKIKELELLHKVYGIITTTSDVANEYGEPLPYWITISELKDKSKQQLLELHLDKGESSAIALETPESTIVLDDYKWPSVSD